MKRLTNKYEDYELAQNFPENKNFGDVCVDDLLVYMNYERKLRLLEDIEEELNFSLILAFEALKNGIIYEGEYHKVRGISKDGLIVIDTHCEYTDCDITAFFDEYGKTWILA